MEDSESENCIVLDDVSFLDEVYDRGGYRIISANPDSTFVQGGDIEVYWDMLVAIDNVETHDPKELRAGNFFSHLQSIQTSLSLISKKENLRHIPSHVFTFWIYNIRTCALRSFSWKYILENSADLEYLPKLGIRIEWSKVAGAIRSMYRITNIKTQSPLQDRDIDTENEVLVGFALEVNSVWRTCGLTEDIYEFQKVVRSQVGNKMALDIYNIESEILRRVDVVIGHLVFLGAHISLTGTSSWERIRRRHPQPLRRISSSPSLVEIEQLEDVSPPICLSPLSSNVNEEDVKEKPVFSDLKNEGILEMCLLGSDFFYCETVDEMLVSVSELQNVERFSIKLGAEVQFDDSSQIVP